MGRKGYGTFWRFEYIGEDWDSLNVCHWLRARETRELDSYVCYEILYSGVVSRNKHTPSVTYAFGGFLEN